MTSAPETESKVLISRLHTVLSSETRSELISEHVTPAEHRHRLPLGYLVVKRSVLGGFYQKVVKVKADVAAILKFFSRCCRSMQNFLAAAAVRVGIV